MLAATLREHKILINREDLEQIAQKTMDETNPKYPGMISYEE